MTPTLILTFVLLGVIGLTYMYKSAQVSFWKSEAERYKHLAYDTKAALDSTYEAYHRTSSNYTELLRALELAGKSGASSASTDLSNGPTDP